MRQLDASNNLGKGTFSGHVKCIFLEVEIGGL